MRLTAIQRVVIALTTEPMTKDQLTKSMPDLDPDTVRGAINRGMTLRKIHARPDPSQERIGGVSQKIYKIGEDPEPPQSRETIVIDNWLTRRWGDLPSKLSMYLAANPNLCREGG